MDVLQLKLSVNTLCTVCSIIMQDLGWYFAKKLEKSGKAGAIPITHVRLVYDSDNGEWLD